MEISNIPIAFCVILGNLIICYIIITVLHVFILLNKIKSNQIKSTLSQLRSGHCRLLNSYQNRLKQTVDPRWPRCPDCGVNPHDVPHLFNCTAHPNALSTVNLWDKPVESIRELSFLDPRNLD